MQARTCATSTPLGCFCSDSHLAISVKLEPAWGPRLESFAALLMGDCVACEGFLLDKGKESLLHVLLATLVLGPRLLADLPSMADQIGE